MNIQSKLGFTLVELLVVIAIIGVLISLLLPAVQQAREAGRRTQCVNQMKQLALAMHHFHDTHNKFPKSASGNPSWDLWTRLSANYKLLPYIEQQALYDSIDLEGDWEDNRRGPLEQQIQTFLCPSANVAPDANTIAYGGPGSHYGWSSGSSPHTGWNSLIKHANGIINITESRRIADAHDGLTNTLLISEMLSGDGVRDDPSYPYDIYYAADDSTITAIADKDFATAAELEAIGTSLISPTGERSNNGTHWGWFTHAQSQLNTTAPPNWKHPSGGGKCCPGLAHDWYWGIIPPRSLHPGGVNTGRGDGSVSFVTNTVDLRTWQRFGHSNDGEVLGEL